MAKFKGQLEDAQLHNKSADPTNLPDGLVWLNTTDNVAKVYAGGAKRTIVTTDQTQTLTNKTLTSPAISSPTGLVKADVGLGNVDNTSDATKNSAAATLTNKTIDADLNTISNIENADIKAGAGIAHSKMAALTASRAMVTDGSGVASASSVTATELGYVSGVTSAIQTQIDSKPTGAASSALWNANKLQGTTVSSSAPSSGQVLKYDGSNWAPARFASYRETDVTANYTVASTDEFIIVTPSSGNVTVTLPDAATNANRVIGFKLRNAVNSYTLSITTAGSDTIDKATNSAYTTLTLKGNLDTVWLIAYGAVWSVISRDQAMRYTAVSTTYSVLDGDEYISASTSGGAFTITLPQAATGNLGRVLTIKKTSSDSNTLTLATVFSQTIDGASGFTLSKQHQVVQVMSDGSNWRILYFDPAGETITASSQPDTAWPVGAGVWTDHASISLTPGTWEIKGQSLIRTTGTAGPFSFLLGISSTSGNSSSGITEGINRSQITHPATTGAAWKSGVMIAGYVVTVSATTTYYLKGSVDNTTNINVAAYQIIAKRIR